MQKSIIFVTMLYLALSGGLLAQNPSTKDGVQKIKSTYFDSVYLTNDLVHYLDNKNLHVTYQSLSTGQFNQPDKMIFSVEGNSYKWNKYYLDGFRLDSRFHVGSTPYKINMSNLDLSLDYIDSELRFTSLENRGSSVAVSYNIGGVGGISPGTAAFIHLFHDTAMDRMYKPIEHRNKVKGAGTIELNYAVKGKDREYMQCFYADYGVRYIVDFDHTGIDSFYPENYGKLQLDGELPFKLNGLFDETNYILAYAGRSNMNSEYNFAQEQTARLNSYNASFYGTKKRDDLSYASGFNFAINDSKHDNLNYSYNVIDQDGEGFEPWQPDGLFYELSHSLTLDKKLNRWLNLSFDGYNSLLGFSASVNNFQNSTFAQGLLDKKSTALYLYEWNSDNFASALLENTVGLNTQRELSEKIDFNASLNLTLDAMIVGENSKVSPNFEAQVGFDFKLAKWLDIQLNLSRKRVNYNIDDIKFLSNDYLSGDVYFVNDKNGDGVYQSGEKGDFFTTTGGSYHTLSKSAKQPSYFTLDIPINLNFGRHTISFLQSYRKYSNLWTVSYDRDASEYGYTVPTLVRAADEEVLQDQYMDVYYLNAGQRVNYVVGDYPDGIMGDNFFMSTPFYFSSNIEYTYTAPKFTFSIAWQSYMMSGLSTLGNGVLHNNIGALSESSANPNTLKVADNLDGKYPAVGRLDQDRAYIARIFASYKITPKFSMAMNAKFTDGQPFSIFRDKIISDNNNNNQIAIFPWSSRGINTTDANFGCREDAIFNIELRAKYRTTIAKRKCEFGVDCYNIVDFGNELTEYVFDEGIEGTRSAMSLTIPRGLIFSFKMDL